MAVCAGTAPGRAPSEDSVATYISTARQQLWGQEWGLCPEQHEKPWCWSRRWRDGDGRGPAAAGNEPPAWWARALPLSRPWPPSLMNRSPSGSIRALEGLWLLKRAQGQLRPASLSLWNPKRTENKCLCISSVYKNIIEKRGRRRTF